MATVLLYIGIVLIVCGWIVLSLFAIKQMRAQKEYERLPQKWNEIKQSFIYKRWIARGIILVGMILLIISIIL